MSPRQGGDEARKKAPESLGQVGQSHVVFHLLRSSSVETAEPAKVGGGWQWQARGDAKQKALKPVSKWIWISGCLRKQGAERSAGGEGGRPHDADALKSSPAGRQGGV